MHGTNHRGIGTGKANSREIIYSGKANGRESINLFVEWKKQYYKSFPIILFLDFLPIWCSKELEKCHFLLSVSGD